VNITIKTIPQAALRDKTEAFKHLGGKVNFRFLNPDLPGGQRPDLAFGGPFTRREFTKYQHLLEWRL